MWIKQKKQKVKNVFCKYTCSSSEQVTAFTLIQHYYIQQKKLGRILIQFLKLNKLSNRQKKAKDNARASNSISIINTDDNVTNKVCKK